jgi:DNA gyrase subunit A
MTELLPAEPRPVSSTSGVKLLNLDTDDKVAAAVVIPPPEDPKSQPENGTLLQ